MPLCKKCDEEEAYLESGSNIPFNCIKCGKDLIEFWANTYFNNKSLNYVCMQPLF